MPLTLVAFIINSALISIALRLAAESVVKKGIAVLRQKSLPAPSPDV